MADIWVISDAKPGHLNQSLGLAEALVRLKPDLSFEIKPVSDRWRLLTSSQAPKLIISAGRRTHLWNWLAKLRYGAKNIVLMRPSLPYACFDLALVPEHDVPPKSVRVVATLGALNRIRPMAKLSNSRAVLVGGPSKHIDWDNTIVLNAIKRLSADYLDICVVTSRRTPVEIEDYVSSHCLGKLVRPSDVPANWLPSFLGQQEHVFVTADSVSMVYESLTAGAKVSLIELPVKMGSRVQSGLKTLIDKRWVGLISSPEVELKDNLFNESERCARLVLERSWL